MKVTGGSCGFKILFSGRVSEDRLVIQEYLKDKDPREPLSPMTIALEVFENPAKSVFISGLLKRLGYTAMSPTASRKLIQSEKPTLTKTLQAYLKDKDPAIPLSPKIIAQDLLGDPSKNAVVGQVLKNLGYKCLSAVESRELTQAGKPTLTKTLQTYLSNKDSSKPLSPNIIALQLLGASSKRSIISVVLKKLGYTCMDPAQSRKETLAQNPALAITVPEAPVQISSVSEVQHKQKPIPDEKLQTYLKDKDPSFPLSPKSIAEELYGESSFYRVTVIAKTLKKLGFRIQLPESTIKLKEALQNTPECPKTRVVHMVNRTTGEIIPLEDPKAVSALDLLITKEESARFQAFLKSQNLDEVQLLESVWDALEYLKTSNFMAYAAICHQLKIYAEEDLLPSLTPANQKKLYKEGLAQLQTWLLQKR